jgi:hypothetical protein
MKQFMLMASLCLSAGLMSCGNSNESSNKNEPATATKEAQMERGRYLVTVIGCGDCHTPKKMTDKGPVPDMERFLAGYDASVPLGEYDTALANSGRWAIMKGDLTAAAGPWGVSFAANLTPDATGIGDWNYETFRRAIKEGKYKGLPNSRPLLPPMPTPSLAQLEEQDVEAIFEYLKTIKPVENLVPQAILNPPPPGGGGHRPG